MAIPTFLANFDQSLAYRDRAGLGSLVASGPVRYEDDAYVAEEGTTNLIPDPMPTTPIPGAGNSTSSIVAKGGVPSGFASKHIITNIVSGQIIANPIIIPTGYKTGGSHTISAYLSVDTPENFSLLRLHIFVRYTDATTSSASGLVTPSTTPQRAEVLLTPNGGKTVDTYYAYVYATTSVAGQVAYISSLQFEQKAYATSFCPQLDGSGNLLPGYTWAGTAHASASTRAESYATLSADHVPTQRGSAIMRVYVDQRGQPYLGLLDGGSGNLRWYLRGGASTVYAWSGTTVDVPIALQDKAWNTFYIQWESGQPIRVAGGPESLVASEVATLPATWSAPFMIGRTQGGAYLNGPIDDLLIFDRPLTDAERTTLVNTESWQWNTLFPKLRGILRIGGNEPLGILRVGGGEVS